MKQKSKILCIMFLCSFYIVSLQGQEAIPATGGTATGSGGSVSYTAGQITYNTISGTNGTVAQGVQHPYEISVATASENAGEITLECTIYPNPTRGIIKLIVESFDNENLRFRLYDINGGLLRDKKVESRETEIEMTNLSTSVYFLKVIINNKEVKVFKIVKN
jgi:hypothetical protein